MQRQSPPAREMSLPQDRSAQDQTAKLDDLPTRAARGGTLTIASQLLVQLVRVGGLAILARLLAPADFGLVAMITAVTAMLFLFRDMGLSVVTIQQAEISQDQLSVLFFANVVFGLLLGTAMYSLAIPVSLFYNEPRLVPLARTMALSFVAIGLSTQHIALLRRRLRFGRVAIIDVASPAIATSLAVGLAIRGYGVWSLVALRVAEEVIRLGAAVLLFRWHPSRPTTLIGFRTMFGFGTSITLFNLLNYFSRNFDKVLVGRHIGETSLGFYSRAYSLLLLPLNQIIWPLSSIAIASLSRVQHRYDLVRSYYLKALELAALCTVPVVVALIVAAPDVVAVLLGPEWSPAARVFRLLGLAALVQPIASTSGWLHMSTRNGRRMIVWGGISAAFNSLAFIVGLQFGIEGVAAAYSVSQLVLAVPGLIYAARPVGMSTGVVIVRYGRHMLAGAVSAGLAVTISALMGAWAVPIIRIAAISISALASYLAALWLIPGGPSPFTTAAGAYRALTRRTGIAGTEIA